MYHVRLHADPEHFLNWDKPLSDQHPHVQKALTPESLGLRMAGPTQDYYGYIGKDGRLVGTASKGKPPDALFYGTERGREIYKLLHPEGAKAAAMLREAGIPGVRYLDGASRGEGVGNHNFVVFDDKTAKVKRRYERGGGV
jgi:hypothetical protein